MENSEGARNFINELPCTQVLHSMLSHFAALCFTTDISDSVYPMWARQKHLIDMVYLTESTVPERRSKYQSAKLLVADLFTSLHLEYSSFLKLHNLVEFWSVDHVTAKLAPCLTNISWLYCSHDQCARFLRLMFVNSFQMFVFRLNLVFLFTKRGWRARLFDLIPRLSLCFLVVPGFRNPKNVWK